MSRSMLNRVVLITGAARGIGESCARAFAVKGARVALCDIDLQTAESVAKDITDLGGQAHAWSLDVCSRPNWEAVVAAIVKKWGGVDVVVGNAGIMPVGHFETITEDVERRQIDINVLGILHGLHASLPHMRQQGSGHFVHVASIAGRVPSPYAAVYSATKFAVVGLTESLRHEFNGQGIHFTTIMPGFVQTELISGLASLAWPKPNSPEDVAAAIVRAVRRKKNRVYVPGYAAILCLAPWLLPHTVLLWFSGLLGLNTILKPVDTQARLAYQERTEKRRD